MISFYVALVVFHAGYLELFPEKYVSWLLVVLCFSVAYIPSTRLPCVRGALKINYSFIVLLLAVSVIEYSRIIFSLTYFSSAVKLSYWLVAISMWLIYINIRLYLSKANSQEVLMAATNFLMVICLFQFFEPHGSLAVSISWLAYATIVIGYAIYKKDRMIVNSALLILSVAAAKALLYDTMQAATIIRIVCLVVTGGILFTFGYLFRHIAKWEESK